MNTYPSGRDAHIRSLIRSAYQAAERGASVEAKQFLAQAQQLSPRHPLVLNEMAKGLIHTERAADGLKLVLEAVRAEPSNPEILYTQAVALRRVERVEDAVKILDKLLKLEPHNMAALFEKAAIEEERGRPRAAIMVYRAVFQMLRSDFQPPKWMEAPLAHARALVDADNLAFEAHVDENLASIRRSDTDLKRFDRCVQIFLQKRKMPRQQPSFLNYPGLPAIEFHDREDFPWLDDLEAAADDIRTEFLEAMDAGGGQTALDPYVADQSGLDVEYYRELNQSRRWGVYPLWREGKEYPEHIARCPRTAAALKHWPKWDVPGCGPTALFSVLAPKTRIPLHSGPVNTRLLAHLALIVPPGCGFRVGDEVREWVPGKAFVFDDSIRHEAWNDSNETRVVMIVDMWSPLLSTPERECVRALTKLIGEWYGAGAMRDLGA